MGSVGSPTPPERPDCQEKFPGRIVAVCDAFDAMCEQRPYNDPLTAAGALPELRRCSGSQFDPEVVEAFARSLGPA